MDMGCEVEYTYHVGEGFPDLTVYNPVNGLLRLLEVKSEKGKLNNAEEKFFKRFGAGCAVVRTKEEAEEAMMVKTWGKGRRRV